MNRETILTPEEAYRIAQKVVGEDRTGEFLTSLTKTLDLAAELKERIASCKFTEEKTVDVFVDKGSISNIRDQLIELNDFWSCSEEVSVPKMKPNATSKLAAMMQWKHLQDLRDALSSDPKGVAELCISYLKTNNIITSDLEPMAILGVEALVSNPEVIKNSLAFIDNLEMGLRSESGKRLIALVPEIMQADTERALELFSKEADYNQEAFFNLIGNNDLAQQFFRQVARFLIGGYELGKQALNDNMKLAIANGLLISNNFPALNKRHLLQSVVKIVEKILSYFTVSRVEEWNMYDRALKFKQEFEKLYFRMERFDDLLEDELVSVLSQFLQDNLMMPMKDAWLVNKFVTSQGNPKCLAPVLCIYKERYATNNEINKMIVDGLTHALVYSWAGSTPESIHQATSEHIPEDGDSCSAKFDSSTLKDCDIFSQSKSNLRPMDLSFDHNEL
ncbi:uncharacterized protein LOC131877838 [Tigriopus californicus]|nr:uncharacterized protein LOC131877838 [Tigriopus californicus]